jgi:hypothetical protein
MSPLMDTLISWSLSLVAVVTFVGSAWIDHNSAGTEFTRTSRLFLLALTILSIGTLLVTTLAANDLPEWAVIVAAFNRAVLASVGSVTLWRSWGHYRGHPRPDRDR